MHIKVLGCSGAIAKDCRTTSFLVNERVLIDAGTGVGDLDLESMQSIEHVFLTHSHLDHIAALPLMLDACASRRHRPVCVHALPQTIEALRLHVFNNLIWPNFERLPSVERPFVRFEALQAGQTVALDDLLVEALPAVHTVPAVGYALHGAQGVWAFTGDTERNPAFWKRINELNVKALVIETAFSDRESELASRSLHLSPKTLALELDQIHTSSPYPIYITHTKPSETALIMEQVRRFDDNNTQTIHVRHDIRALKGGMEFHL